MPASTRSSSAPDPPTGPVRITILAGGTGSRFWPLSTARRPKQLLPLAGPRPMVAEAVARAVAIAGPEAVRILAGEHLTPLLRSALPDLPASAYLVEPRARGTAPVLAWAAHRLVAEDPDTVQVSLHADHHIRPVEAFQEVVGAAVELAERHDLLVTVGARPDRPETGYGYIQPGEALATPFHGGAFGVDTFHEKPDRTTAEQYVEDGYLWNTGIFVWKASRLLEAIRRHAPEIGQHLELLDRGDEAGFFEAVPKMSVDVAVMERSRLVAVVPATFEWDDIGAWHALHRTCELDGQGNAVLGDGHVVDGRGNVVYADDGPLVVFGVDDLVAVHSGGVTLVTSRARAPDLKELLDALPPEAKEGP